jgi:hypothetical protein
MKVARADPETTGLASAFEKALLAELPAPPPASTRGKRRRTRSSTTIGLSISRSSLRMGNP